MEGSFALDMIETSRGDGGELYTAYGCMVTISCYCLSHCAYNEMGFRVSPTNCQRVSVFQAARRFASLMTSFRAV